MKTHNNVNYEIWNTHFIKFTYKPGVIKEGGVVYRTGEAFATIPDNLKQHPDLFARMRIDSLYRSAKSHKDHELRKRLK